MFMRHVLAGVAATLLMSTTFAAEKQCTLAKVGELPATMSGARAIISGTINGKPLRFLVDSGAFFSILTRDTVQHLALREGPLPYGFNVGGIGGRDNMGLISAKEFSLVGFSGGHIYNNVDFLVTGSALGNVNGVIGQNLLSIADAEYDLANGVIRLFNPKDCADRSLAYWHGDTPVAEMRIDATTPLEPHWKSKAKINDRKITVMFDSGSNISILDRAAAAKIGITPQTEGVSAAGVASGVGPDTVETVYARFNTLDLGGEQIKNARLFVGDLGGAGDVDLLLGADFFLSHHLYFSPKQNKLYFTYNGGPVFELNPYHRRANTATLKSADISESQTDASPVSEADAHLSAADWRRRGTALVSRRDFDNALQAFNQAVKLDANDAENFYERGKLYGATRQLQNAITDLDQALSLKPDFVAALLARGELRLRQKDAIGASADFDAALHLNPDDSDVAYEVASAYSSVDQHAEAITRFSSWIAKFPKDSKLPRALNNRCWSRAIVGEQLDLALADCNQALKVGPRNSQVLDSRAFVHLRRGEYDQAISDYQAVLKLQPKQAISLYGLGVAEFKKGFRAAGEQDIQAAVALSPRVAEFYNKLNITP